MAHAAGIFGDRWVLLILRGCFYGITRFEDLRADLDAPRAVLSQRLSFLVSRGLLERSAYQEAGSRTRFEYRLTRTGLEAVLVLLALKEWGDRNLLGENSEVQLAERATGRPLHVSLVTSEGTAVDPQDAEVRLKEGLSPT
jgi:DNA-binding HxlR family transcriptional regulator